MLSLGAPLARFTLATVSGVSLLSYRTRPTLRSRLTGTSGNARETLFALQSTHSVKTGRSWRSVTAIEAGGS